MEAGRDAFYDYSHLFSPHKFTQPQLFACLVLKEFENQDYRGIHQALIDHSDLRQVLGLSTIPHYTTLQKAIDQLDGVVEQLPPSVRVKHRVADAGFDSAHNHQLLREDHGIRSTIPPDHGRPLKDPNALPANKYRRLMKTRFNDKAYRHRPQVETVFSMIKRNLGSALHGRSYWSRCRDMLLKGVTHNITLC